MKTLIFVSTVFLFLLLSIFIAGSFLKSPYYNYVEYKILKSESPDVMLVCITQLSSRYLCDEQVHINSKAPPGYEVVENDCLQGSSQFNLSIDLKYDDVFRAKLVGERSSMPYAQFKGPKGRKGFIYSVGSEQDTKTYLLPFADFLKKERRIVDYNLVAS